MGGAAERADLRLRQPAVSAQVLLHIQDKDHLLHVHGSQQPRPRLQTHELEGTGRQTHGGTLPR